MRPPSPAAFGTGIAIPVPAWTRRYRSMSFRYPRFGNHGPGASAFPDGRSSEPISGMFAIRWAFGRLCGWDRGSKAQGSMKRDDRSEEHTTELPSLMRISYAVFCLNKKTNTDKFTHNATQCEISHETRQQTQ